MLIIFPSVQAAFDALAGVAQIIKHKSKMTVLVIVTLLINYASWQRVTDTCE